MILFDFVVTGTPVSVQTRRRQERLVPWKARVRSAASTAWTPSQTPFDARLCVALTYFYEGQPPDVDNIIKPILDSVKSLVYEDDRQITDVVSRNRPIAGPYVVEQITPSLAAALSGTEESCISASVSHRAAGT